MLDVRVHTDRWRNYDTNAIVGDQFTLSSSDALILIAFISLFDALIGNIAWSLIAFYIFHARATEEPKDALFHQLQTLCRNTSDALTFSRDAFTLGWEWLKKARHALLRCWGYALLSLSVSLLFSAAGVLSSRLPRRGKFCWLVPHVAKSPSHQTRQMPLKLCSRKRMISGERASHSAHFHMLRAVTIILLSHKPPMQAVV